MGIRTRYQLPALIGLFLTSLFFLSPDYSQGATRKTVSLPSKQSTFQNPSGTPTRTGGTVSTTGQPLEGEYIPGINGNRIPVRGILPKVEYGLNTVFTKAKSGWRGGALGVAGSIGLGLMLDQIGAFIDENGQPVKLQPDNSVPISEYFMCRQVSGSSCTTTSTNPAVRKFSTFNQAIDYEISSRSLSQNCTLTSSGPETTTSIPFTISCANKSTGAIQTIPGSLYKHGTCSPPASYSQEKRGCFTTTKVPLADSDYDLMFDYANQQNAEWLNGLLKDICNGSPNPGGCFDEMLSNAPLAGPSSVNGPSTVTTTTTTSPTGVSTQTVTTATPIYNIRYNINNYDYSKTTKTTTVVNGQPVSETTETEIQDPSEEPQEETPPEEDSYTFTDPEFPPVEPFYEQKYPDGLQGVWDDSTAQMQGSEFVSFLNSFVPSFSGSCPSWSMSFNIMEGANYGTIAFMNICYVFDFIKIIMLVTALFTCRAIIFGG